MNEEEYGSSFEFQVSGFYVNVFSINSDNCMVENDGN